MEADLSQWALQVPGQEAKAAWSQVRNHKPGRQLCEQGSAPPTHTPAVWTG